MSAKYDDFRAQLDAMMGQDRNLAPGEERKAPLHYSDPSYCKLYLAGLCPHQLFVNTKSDLGPCDKVHDEAVKDAYLADPERDRFNYDRELIRYLKKIIDDLDRRYVCPWFLNFFSSSTLNRIKRGHDRLTQTQSGTTPADDEVANQVDSIAERTEFLLKEVRTSSSYILFLCSLFYAISQHTIDGELSRGR